MRSGGAVGRAGSAGAEIGYGKNSRCLLDRSGDSGNKTDEKGRILRRRRGAAGQRGRACAAAPAPFFFFFYLSKQGKQEEERKRKRRDQIDV
jgi:hypothetical protein